jgi:peptide/nickel transport system substrate-binding protein
VTRRGPGIPAIALGAVVAVAAAGCGLSSGAFTPAAPTVTAALPAKAGGTLYYLSGQASDHLDPQRTYITRDIANEVRMLYRTLTSFPAASGKAGTRLVADLATDTGTAAEGGKIWRFTLKDGVKWQDGSEITCADLRYGVSRTFATTVLTGGPSYGPQFLDIPTDPRGGSLYKGPYVADPAGQRLFDKAVTCDNRTITFRLSKPVADFNEVASRPDFAPYRADLDRGDKSNFTVFSSGPYQLQGPWTKGQGGTFVRNPNWSRGTDTIRKAFPDKIVLVEGLSDMAIAQRLISNQLNDQYAVTDRSIPPELRPNVNVNPAMSTRSESVDGPFVDYLVPTVTTQTSPLVRQALAVATDKSSWVAASGGPGAGKPAQSIISASVPGYTPANVFTAADAGDPSRSRALLAHAGVRAPYPVTYTYLGDSLTAQRSAAALKAGWEAGGFSVTLNDLADAGHAELQKPASANGYDLTAASWAAGWPSASSVIPELFDSRVNVSAGSTRAESGAYRSDAVNSSIDAAYAQLDPAAQAKMWGDIDKSLAKDVAYIPLGTAKLFLAWGSRVTGWIDNPAVSGDPDLAVVGVSVPAK